MILDRLLNICKLSPKTSDIGIIVAEQTAGYIIIYMFQYENFCCYVEIITSK